MNDPAHVTEYLTSGAGPLSNSNADFFGPHRPFL